MAPNVTVHVGNRGKMAHHSQMTIKRVYKDIIVFLPPLSKVGFLFSLISDIK